MSPPDGRPDSQVASNLFDPLAGWLTLAAFLAILVLAFFPFNFSAQATAFRRIGPFYLWFTPVAKDRLGWFLNVLFFAPLGFGWAWWSAVKRWRLWRGWVAVLLIGFALSMAVETLQLYLPTRDSSWDDVVMNTLGAYFGWLFFRCYGEQCLRLLGSAIEDLNGSLER